MTEPLTPESNARQLAFDTAVDNVATAAAELDQLADVQGDLVVNDADLKTLITAAHTVLDIANSAANVLLSKDPVPGPLSGRCAVCGCSDDNACVYYGLEGQQVTACRWTHPDLCSACDPNVPDPLEAGGQWVKPTEDAGAGAGHARVPMHDPEAEPPLDLIS